MSSASLYYTQDDRYHLKLNGQSYAYTAFLEDGRHEGRGKKFESDIFYLSTA